MEALRHLLSEMELSRRLGDLADVAHGMRVLRWGIFELSEEPDPLIRAVWALEGLREMSAANERHGHLHLAAHAGALIAELEREMAKLAQAAERELERRRLQ